MLSRLHWTGATFSTRCREVSSMTSCLHADEKIVRTQHKTRLNMTIWATEWGLHVNGDVDIMNALKFHGYSRLQFQLHCTKTIGTTRPIPPNRRSCLGCIWWKYMSNPKTPTLKYSSYGNLRKPFGDYEPIWTSWTTRNRNYSANSA